MRATVTDILTAVFLLALVTLMVRPGSRASEVITLLGGAFDHLVGYAVNG